MPFAGTALLNVACYAHLHLCLPDFKIWQFVCTYIRSAEDCLHNYLTWNDSFSVHLASNPTCLAASALGEGVLRVGRVLDPEGACRYKEFAEVYSHHLKRNLA